MNNKGFVSTALIYTFFILFLILMLLLLGKYSRTRFLLERYKNQIKEDMYELNNGDINVYFMVWDDNNNNWTIEKEIPRIGYSYEGGQCDNGSTIQYEDGFITVDAQTKDTCFVYFKSLGQDITLRIYALPADFDLNNTDSMEVYTTDDIPGSNYSFSNCTCDIENVACQYDSTYKMIKIESDSVTTCKAIFINNESSMGD